MTAPGGLVLAAGGGRRFGQAKALVDVDGQLLVDRAVAVLRSAGCAPIVVVVGAAAAAVRAKADLADVVVVDNPDWESGLASSFRSGVAALAELGAPAAVILLVDQPGIGADVLLRLVERWRAGAPAVVASYGGQPRNPVVLDASVWDDAARAATGDQGARAWLRANPEQVTAVACDDLGDPADIDTPADLARLRRDV